MKVFYLLLVTAFLLPYISNAQSNYKPGYVITLKGDTLNGFIDYREWDKIPRSVKFKPTLTADVQKLTPSNTIYIDINGLEAFRRYAGPITLDAISESHILNGRDTTFRIDTIFLNVLQKGDNITLYAYADNTKTRFYYSDKSSDVLQELGYRLYYDVNNVDIYKGRGRTVNENTYMKQLYNLAQKYNVLTPKLQRTIEDSRYVKPYILNIVSKINGLKK